jgi:predicted membrane-bound spermidine synthase
LAEPRIAPLTGQDAKRPGVRVLTPLILAVSFLTGASSFIYEIGWIRMLSLVLGSATHSFELMLSSFILGLALGGLWIRKRVDTRRAGALQTRS